jgi:predicted negative regulator of RcsB-dependent stress response
MSDEADHEAPEPVEEHVIDLLPDELSLARAQLDAGQAGLAEGTLRHRIAFREADGASGDDELDALRALLAESLWRQGRLMAARTALEAIRPSSPQRRLPIVTMIEAEALAAAGEPDRATGALERVIAAVGVDEAHALRAGVTGRLSWPLPSELRPQPAQPPRPPWTTRSDETQPEPSPLEGDDARAEAARSRLEEARVAFVAGDLARGDAEMSIAVRLDPGLAADGVEILEPTLGRQPAAERLLLYGDLLRAAGRRVEADQAYDRAADRRS